MNREDEHSAMEACGTSSPAPVPPQKRASFVEERSPQMMEVAPQVLRHWTRRDLLLFGVGALAAITGGGALLPQTTLKRLGIIEGDKGWPQKEWLLNRALRFDDDVAEALYSKDHLVPTYTRSQITPLKNNYNGATPDPGYIPDWRLTLDGLHSGLSVVLSSHSSGTGSSSRRLQHRRRQSRSNGGLDSGVREVRWSASAGSHQRTRGCSGSWARLRLLRIAIAGSIKCKSKEGVWIRPETARVADRAIASSAHRVCRLPSVVYTRARDSNETVSVKQ